MTQSYLAIVSQWAYSVGLPFTTQEEIELACTSYDINQAIWN